MKKLLLIILLCTSLLGGCVQSREVENQAYAIVMGVDHASNEIEVCIKFPSISSSGEKDSSSGTSQYKMLTAAAANFRLALEKIRHQAPRKLNLSHLDLLVLSKNMAKSPSFRELIEDIAQTERLYTASYVLLCDGSAAEYVAQLEPAVGSRLSMDIPAQFEHLSEQGIIPDARLADLYYLTESVYSDPMAARTQITDEKKPQMSGSIVFSDGRYTLELNEKQSVLTNLIKNEVRYFRYNIDGKIIEAAPSAPAELSVDISQYPAKLKLKLRLSIGSQKDMPAAGKIREQITRDVTDLIQLAQQSGTDPFGFSEKAAKKHPTIKSWMNSNWDSVYMSAIPVVEVDISRWDA